MPRYIAHKVLSRDETVGLIRLAQQGNMAARDQIVACNQGLIRIVGKRFIKAYPEWSEDAIQFGNLGLIMAIDSFDIGHNVAFGSYAGKLIRSHIIRGYRDTFRLVRLPSYLYDWLDHEDPMFGSHSTLGEHDIWYVDHRDSAMEIDRREEIQVLMAKIDDAFSVLTPRERDFATRHLYDGVTMVDIGREAGISLERVRMIVGEAILKARRQIREAS